MPAMTRTREIVAAAAAALFMLAATASSAAAVEEFRSVNVAKDGIRIVWLRDHSVINDQNEKIGTIYEFVVGRDLTLFAILQIGEFLELKEHLVAIRSRRWSSMTPG
jgi:hypothetical protein